jgi:hypothetical protein
MADVIERKPNPALHALLPGADFADDAISTGSA